MEQQRRRRVIDSVRRAVWADDSVAAPTDELPVIDDSTAVRILDLAMRVAEAMLQVGASAKEVTLAALRVTGAYGLRSVHVNVTYNSVMVSDHRYGEGLPITLMRVVRAAVPDHTKLQRLQALVTDVESGVDLTAARAQFRAIRRLPFRYRPAIVVVSQALLAVAVGLLYGAPWFSLVVIFIAGLGVALTQAGLAKLGVPVFFSQVAGAFVITAIAVLAAWLGRIGVPPFMGVRLSVVVASGIVLMLAGLAVVGAAQDAIDGFSLTAGGRILELSLQTLGVVLGILLGLQSASALGIGIPAPSEAPPFGSLPAQYAGVIVIAITVAVMNGSGLRITGLSAVLAVIAWTAYTLTRLTGIDVAAASFAGAFVASIIGAVFAYRFAVPSIAITTAAIVPLVPGSAVFRGLLGIVEAGGDTPTLIIAVGNLITAALIGIALAAGASLGLFVGSPLRRSIGGARARVDTVAPGTSAGTAAITIIRDDEPTTLR